MLVYTSGTTGTPKGVPLSHRNLCTNIQALLREQLAGADDRVLLPLPLHHAYPLTVGLLSALATGAAVVLPSGISGPEISHALAECRCTIMVGVPRLYEAMLAGIERRLAGQRAAGPARAPGPAGALARAPPPLRLAARPRACSGRCIAASARRCGCSPRAAPGSSPRSHGGSKASAGRC